MSFLGVVLASAALAAGSSAPVVELGARVTGNQEQPRVLYIVPWQAPDGPDSLYRDIGSRIDKLFDPVDRESFKRELHLLEQFEQLSGDSVTP